MDANGSATHDSAADDLFDWTPGDEVKTNRQTAEEKPYQPRYARPARRPSTEREDAFNALAWLADGASGLAEELRHNDLGLSEDFWIHLYAARQESLLAARALVDSLLERTERQLRREEEREQRRSRRGGIDIDF
jgi:hypothetical protein